MPQELLNDPTGLLSDVWLDSTLAPPLLELGPDGKIISVNDAYCTLVRSRREDLLGRSPLEMTHPDDIEATIELLCRRPPVRENGARIQKRYVLPDGEVISVLVSAVWSEDDQRIFSYVTDVTELVAAQSRCHALIEHSGDLIFVIDRSGLIVDANPATVRFAGAPTGRESLSVINDLVHPDDRDSVVRHWSTVAATPGVHPPNTFRVKDLSGAWRNLALIANNQLADPAIAGIVVNARDVTAEVEQIDTALRNQESLVSAITKITEVRDPYTAGHQRNVAELSAAIGAEMGLTDQEIRDLRLGATLHDLGKIGVPTELLTRPGRLSDPERELIRTHCRVGYDIVSAADLPDVVADIVLHHHERLDGSGYPDGLSGDQISRPARIVAVADVLDAMSSHRPYREALGLGIALDEVTTHQGHLYCPDVVAAAQAIAQPDPRQHRSQSMAHMTT